MLKRLFDFLIALVVLIILFPLMLFLAIMVWVVMGRSVLFRQQRPGLHGKPFTIYKFRTMTDERDEEGNLPPDRERLTRLGQFLRKTSMD